MTTAHRSPVRVPGRRVHRAHRVGGSGTDRGAAAVEFALILPLVLLLVFGIIDFGRVLNLQITLTSAAREGARWAALRQSGVPARVAAAAPGVSPAPSVSVTSCPAGAAAGSDATVVATTTYTMITPIAAVAGLLGGGFPGAVTLTGRGVMRCGG
jgi:Flp pilus assembly protein TadG